MSATIAGLFHGPTLGLTICGLSLLIAGGFLFVTRARRPSGGLS